MWGHTAMTSRKVALEATILKRLADAQSTLEKMQAPIDQQDDTIGKLEARLVALEDARPSMEP